MPVILMDDARRGRVEGALALINLIGYPGHGHIFREVASIEFNPIGSECQAGAGACAGGYLGRRIVFVDDPLVLDPIFLAGRLVHEGLHIGTDAYGQMITWPHTCSDALCHIQAERQRDPIYREEASVIAQLQAYFGIWQAYAMLQPHYSMLHG